MYRGNEAIKTLLKEILQYPESYWLGGNSMENYKATTKGLQTYYAHWMEERAQKKHFMHDLVSYGTWLTGYEPEKREVHKKKHYEYRQLPKGWYSPLVIIIFGNKVAQVIWQKQPFAFVLESEKVRESFMRYFNYFWEKAPEARSRR